MPQSMCQFTKFVWGYFINLFQLSDAPQSMCHIWGEWTSLLRPANWDRGILVVKAIVWHIWFAHNDRIY